MSKKIFLKVATTIISILLIPGISVAKINNGSLKKDRTKISVVNRAPVDFRKKENNNEALLWAAFNNEPEKITSLLRRGANPNYRAVNGATPLHYAARGCSDASIRKLIRSGASLNAQDHAKDTPLHYAVQERCSSGVKTLVSNKAKTNMRNKSKKTPLELSAKLGSNNINSLLRSQK